MPIRGNFLPSSLFLLLPPSYSLHLFMRCLKILIQHFIHFPVPNITSRTITFTSTSVYITLFFSIPDRVGHDIQAKHLLKVGIVADPTNHNNAATATLWNDLISQQRSKTNKDTRDSRFECVSLALCELEDKNDCFINKNL